MTKTFTTRIVVFVSIVFLALSMSACNISEAAHEVVDVAASAVSVDDGAANAMALSLSDRISNCDASARQNLIFKIQKATNPNTGVVDGVTLGQWLDGRMSTNRCITPAK